MGSRRAQKLHHKKRKPGITIDDAGQLSIDFLAGISIFVITIIIASTMISSLLIGLQSKRIDYDAVAYRTGVILVEDPGEPNTQFNYLTITEADQWEFIGFFQKDKVRRFGLSLYKSTPHVLAEQKILSFFNRARFPENTEYRDRMIAGDFPYSFNVSLKMIGGDTYYVGDIFEPNSSYGYIRRVVLVKNQTQANVNMKNYYIDYPDPDPESNRFNVNLTYGWLLNQAHGPQYWIEPPKEDITINLINFDEIRNKDPLLPPGTKVSLNNIRMTFDGKLLDGTNVTGVDLPYRDFTVEIDGIPTTFQWPVGAGVPKPVDNYINITFPAGYFIPPSAYADITLIRMNIRYEFVPDTVNLSSSFNSYEYLPTSDDFSPPYLNPAIMEVRVW